MCSVQDRSLVILTHRILIDDEQGVLDINKWDQRISDWSEISQCNVFRCAGVKSGTNFVTTTGHYLLVNVTTSKCFFLPI